MTQVLKSIITKVRVYLMRRRQFDSGPLREHFLKHHQIEVGLYSYGCFDQWRMPGPMRVGRYCSIASSARSVLENHPIEALTTHPALYERKFGVVQHDLARERPLIIEDDVWIGHDVVIVPGCKFIGRGAIIGAGSVVTKDVAPYTVVAGNPARKLRDRYQADLAAAIELSGWWKLDLAELGRLVEDREAMVFRPTVAGIEDWLRDLEQRAR